MEDKIFVPREISPEDSLAVAKAAIEILDTKKSKEH